MKSGGVVVIAEAGVNHNGDLSLAKDLISVASDAGADYVKFQTFTADKLVSQGAMPARYQIVNTGLAVTQFNLLKKFELSQEAHFELIQICKEKSIKFASTGFDLESNYFLDTLGVDFLKIPSGEITNLPYLRQIGAMRKHVLLSTGMSDLNEIGRAIVVLQESGLPLDFLTVLQCTSAYPTPAHEVNLSAMKTIQSTFGVKVGFSDHTLGIDIPLAATALGARVIEKHFTLSRDLEGPDHKASLEPSELAEMVRGIRNIEVAIGDGNKIPTPTEYENREFTRKSIVAKIQIIRGEIFTSDNLTTLRPGNGVSPMRWDDLIGQVSTQDYHPGDQIQL